MEIDQLAGLWISESDFHCKVFAFCILYCRFSDHGYLGVNRQSNLLHRCCDCNLFNLLFNTILLYILFIFYYISYLIQPKRQEVANIGTGWGDIIYDSWNEDLLTIHFLGSSS